MKSELVIHASLSHLPNLSHVVVCVPLGKEFLKHIAPDHALVDPKDLTRDELDELVDEELPEAEGAAAYLAKRFTGIYSRSGAVAKGRRPSEVTLGDYELARDVAISCDYHNDILVFDGRTGAETDILKCVKMLAEKITGDDRVLCHTYIKVRALKAKAKELQMCFFSI